MRRDRRRFIAGAVAALAAPGIARAAGPALPEPDSAARARMANRAASFLREHSVPGLGVAFAQGGKVAYSAAFGSADLNAGTALTQAHRFRLASVSKSITSVAIFTLVDAGRLSLDAHALGPSGVLGTLNGAVPAGSPLAAITLRHLLTHTAGGWSNESNDPMFISPDIEQRNLIERTLRGVPLKTAPGAAYAYSNFGYCLLGRVIEAVTGKSYESYVREAILAPAGAAGMGIAGNTLADRRPDEVRYHSADHENPYAMNVRRMDSHGGWLATPSEVALFLDAAGMPLLSAAAVKAMTTPSPVYPSYACGWRINTAGNRWHTGSLPGTSTLAVRTARGLCWAGLVNTRKRGDIPNALDRLMWAMAREVPAWRA